LRLTRQQIRQLAEMGFKFKDKEDPFRYLPSVAQNMQVYPEKYILAGDHLNEDYDPELILQTLNYFTPENMRVHIASTKFEGKTDKEERWYMVNYREEDITDEEIKVNKNISCLEYNILTPRSNG